MSLDLEREQTVQQLCRHFALDRLTTQELEARLEAAYRAGTSHELRALVAGLPALPATAADQRAGTVPQVYGATVPEQRMMAVFGSVRKRGDWEVAATVQAKAIFGDMRLDFREARLTSMVTTVHVSSTFASVLIIVPPGLRVECDGSAILGEFSHRSSMGEPNPDAPTLRILGMAVFGNVEVKVRETDYRR